MRESGPVERVKEQLRHDRRNMEILKSDKELNRQLIAVPDCADIVEFLHIEDPSKELDNAYREAVRRCFLVADQLVLIPSWMYEFLDYMHRAIVGNIQNFAYEGGLDAFMRQYPRAQEFLELWNTREFEQAEKLYSEQETWVQILALTRDENVTYLLGNPMRRFNVLVESGRLAPMRDYLKGTALGFDGATFNATLSRLNKVRPNPQDQKKNEVDARSLAMLAWANWQGTGPYFAAVTSARLPLLAFYDVIDEKKGKKSAPEWMSLARSPITGLIGARIEARCGQRSAEFLERGISIANDLINDLESLESSSVLEHYTGDIIPSVDLVKRAKTEGGLNELLNVYNRYYREPIFRPVEKGGRAPRQVTTLSPEEGAAAMNPDRFRKSMREARKALQQPARSMMKAAEQFVQPGQEGYIGGKRLGQLFREIAADLARDVF